MPMMPKTKVPLTFVAPQQVIFDNLQELINLCMKLLTALSTDLITDLHLYKIESRILFKYLLFFTNEIIENTHLFKNLVWFM